MTDVTSNNISNANNAGYTRQRVDVAARTPILMGQKVMGQGAQVITVERVFDDFLYGRLKDASKDQSYSKFQEETLAEISTYYPDIDNVGIYNDIKNFFDSWQELAGNGDDPSLKQILATNTETLSQNLKDLRSRLSQIQTDTYGDMKVLLNEVNRLGKEIASINKEIKLYEQEKIQTPANDLRDRRDQMELALSELIGSDVFKKNIQTNAIIDNRMADFDENYTLQVAGTTVVDGINFHPITIGEELNVSGFFNIYYEKSDGTKTDLTNKIKEGKIGAMLDLCKGRVESDEEICGTYGKIQGYIDDLDTFARGLIENVNNIYAHSAAKEMVSPSLSVVGTDHVTESYLHISQGTFDIKMYNSEGAEQLSKTITINRNTTMDDIITQINANTDDNKNLNGLDDFDDFFTASFDSNTGIFQITPKTLGNGLYFAIEDNGTNFGGAIGLNRFLEGDSADNINLAARYRTEPTQINAYSAPAEGNIVVANMMQQLQYDKIDFYNQNGTVSTETVSGFFRKASTTIGSDYESALTLLETRNSVHSSIKLQFSSVSEVNIDEELTNLMRFQTGYTANAKVITTIDQMINTLLGIKQ